MVRAHSLFFALVIAVIMGLISGSLILYTSYERHIAVDRLSLTNDLRDLESGLNIGMAKDESGVFFLDEEGEDSIKVTSEQWGLFRYISVSKNNGSSLLRKSALVGYRPTKDVALYVQDRNSPIVFSGKTLVKGTVYAPKAGVKRGYRKKQAFSSSSGKLVDGIIRLSKKEFIGMNTNLLKENITNLHYKHLVDHDYQSQLEGDITVPFDSVTTIVHTNRVLSLRNISIKGKVILSSAMGVEVDASCSLEDVLIYAPYVHFGKGFSGAVQVFVTEELICDNDCSFEYPSSFTLVVEKSEQKQRIVLGEYNEFAGVICLYQQHRQRELPFFRIQKGTIVEGIVCVDGKTDIDEGIIHGSLWTAELKENGIINGTIDISELDDHFLTADLIGNTEQQEVIKWLE